MVFIVVLECSHHDFDVIFDDNNLSEDVSQEYLDRLDGILVGSDDVGDNSADRLGFEGLVDELVPHNSVHEQRCVINRDHDRCLLGNDFDHSFCDLDQDHLKYISRIIN